MVILLSSNCIYHLTLFILHRAPLKEHATENLFFWKAIERLEDLMLRITKQEEQVRSGNAKTNRLNVVKGEGNTGFDVSGASKIKGGNNPKSMRFKEESNISVDLQAKKVFLSGVSNVREVVKSVMEEYVAEGSPSQVNLPGKLRVIVEKEVAAWLDSTAVVADSHADFTAVDDRGLTLPKDLFTKAKTEAYMVMRKDTFARWRFTEEFSQFVSQLTPLTRQGSLNMTNNMYRRQSGADIQIDIQNLKLKDKT